MKLSEMSTKQLAAALCQLTAPMSRIAKSEAINGVFAEVERKIKENQHMTVFEKIGMLMETVPALLENHYDDTIRIAAIMTGRTTEEVEALNGYALIEEMRDCIDKQFLGFFRSSAAMAQTAKVKGE